jgi:hypothetical protein
MHLLLCCLVIAGAVQCNRSDVMGGCDIDGSWTIDG